MQRKQEQTFVSPELPKRLKKLRDEKGWSQRDIGRQFKFDSQRVSKYESGALIPTTNMIVRLAMLFEASLDDLLRDDVQGKDNKARVFLPSVEAEEIERERRKRLGKEYTAKNEESKPQAKQNQPLKENTSKDEEVKAQAEPTSGSLETTIKNKKLIKRIAAIDTLSEESQNVLIALLDAFIKQQKFEDLVHADIETIL